MNLSNLKDNKYNNDWLLKYENIMISPERAISLIKPGNRIFISSACSQPQILIDTLIAQARHLVDIEIVHLLTLSDTVFRHAELAKNFRLNPFFSAEWSNNLPKASRSNYTPVFLSDIPKIFISGRLPIDVALIQVTPPNENGICSLGISVDITKSVIETAGLVIAQVNSQMPWTNGDSSIDIYNVDYLVPCDASIPEVVLSEPTQASRKIAQYIASLIPDGSTIELGICGISQALSEFLMNKHDLGIHSEVIGDFLIDLIESGVITGLCKNQDRGKVVCSLCLGTERLYSYVDRNPMFCFCSADKVSDPGFISQQQNMVAVNTAEEVDLTGQVSARMSHHGVSGIDICADFVHGTAKTKSGRLIVALESTVEDGTASRIVSCLSDRSDIVATNREVHYVVTEYGTAYLYGKSFQERAMSLISIAHPDFREGLLKEAILMELVSPSLSDVEGRFHIIQPEIKTSYVLENGTQINVRPMNPTDERSVRSLFHSLSQQTKYYRFMSQITSVPQKQIQNFVYTDYRSEMAIVGTIPEAHGEEIIAIGRYYIDPQTNRAEVAFIVRDDWQDRGIGTFLYKTLIAIAKQNGIEGFSAEVLIENKPMLAVLHKGDCKLSSRTEGRVSSINIDFD